MQESDLRMKSTINSSSIEISTTSLARRYSCLCGESFLMAARPNLWPPHASMRDIDLKMRGDKYAV
ncbi:hypothetical protein DTW90_30230 [Neorhizobium sp. P12A]|nr:hypothetical protein DTW90_30230 [Neorhizobium sp. P12A]